MKPQQFQYLADAANAGGFSMYMQGPEPERVTDSYMVGGQVPTASHDSPITGEPIQQFHATHRGTLQQPDRALGAWHDESRLPHSQVDLDVSVAFPRTAEGNTAARAETVAKDERAYWELDEAGDYAGSHNNPFSRQAMGRDPADKHYLGKRESSVRGEHFRSGINSSALFKLLGGDREAGIQDWVHHDASRTP